MLFNGTDAALLETFTDNEDEARLSMIPRGGVEAWLGTIEHKIGRSLLYVYIITRYPCLCGSAAALQAIQYAS